jgi:hypothetical protein
MWNFEELEEDMNNLDDDCPEPHLMRQEYERSLNTEYRLNNDDSINITTYSVDQGIVDNIMAELQQKYNLRPKDRNITIAQLNNIFSRSKYNEAMQTKATETQTAKTKVAETQTAKTKVAETQTTKTKATETQTAKTKIVETKET